MTGSDTVTVLTPIPPWWSAGEESDDGTLSDAVALLVREHTGHHPVSAPELVDSFTATEGLTYVWAVKVEK